MPSVIISRHRQEKLRSKSICPNLVRVCLENDARGKLESKRGGVFLEIVLRVFRGFNCEVGKLIGKLVGKFL